MSTNRPVELWLSSSVHWKRRIREGRRVRVPTRYWTWWLIDGDFPIVYETGAAPTKDLAREDARKAAAAKRRTIVEER